MKGVWKKYQRHTQSLMTIKLLYEKYCKYAIDRNMQNQAV